MGNLKKKKSLLFVATSLSDGKVLSRNRIDVTNSVFCYYFYTASLMLEYYEKVTVLTPRFDIKMQRNGIIEPFNIPYILLDDKFDISSLEEYSNVVYNLGNHPIYHDIYKLYMKKTYPVIIHDQRLVELVDTSINYDLDLWRQENNIQAVSDYFRPILERSFGVFCHAQFFKDFISKNSVGPIGFSYLHCEEKVVSSKDVELYYSLIPKDDKITIVSTGFVAQTKHIDKVVYVLEHNKDIADRVKYIVLGGYSSNEEHEKYVAPMKELSLGKLKGSLYFLGFQNSNIMNAAIKNADLIFNLRYPNTEVCSLSLLEQMSFGKPVVSLNSGIYGEIPDDSIIKISLENEIKDIEVVLRSFLKLPKKNVILKDYNFESTGKNAYNFVKNRCSTNIYAKNLRLFLDECNELNFEKQRFAVELTDSLQRVTRELGIKPNACNVDDEYLTNITDRIYSILGGLLDDEGSKGKF